MNRMLYIVQNYSNPSTDFFVRHFFSSQGFELHFFSLNELPPSSSLMRDDVSLSVVLVRYLSGDWKKWLDINGCEIENIYYFMDDDLLDLTASAGLSWRYRFKLWRDAYRYWSWMKKIGVRLVVSNSYLADKYADLSPEVLKPIFPYSFLVSPDYNCEPVFFYHGSSSHWDEIEWLVPIVEGVMQKHPTVCFEIIGDVKVRALFSHLQRVHVLLPMSWKTYGYLLKRGGRRVGLAPLLDKPFNRARSATKFYDISATGAVGVYAKHTVYSQLVTDGVNGLLVEAITEAWIQAILLLLENNELHQRLFVSAKQVCFNSSIGLLDLDLGNDVL